MKIVSFYFTSSGNTLKFLNLTEKIIKYKIEHNIIFNKINIENYTFLKHYIFESKKKNLSIKNSNDKIFLKEYQNINFLIQKSDLIIVAFPVFFYQAPKIIYKFFDFIFNYNKKEFEQNIYSKFIKKPLILLSTNGGEPANSFYKLYKKFSLKNIVFSYSMHFEDNHPSLRQKFNPFISKGYPTKKTILKYKKILIKFFKKTPEKHKKIIKFNPFYILLEPINLFYKNKTLFNILNKKKIDNSKCIKCYLCVKKCPAESLFLIQNKDNYINSKNYIYNNSSYQNIGKSFDLVSNNNIQFDISKCIGCYRCINICPVNAINTYISKWGIKYKRYIKLIN